MSANSKNPYGIYDHDLEKSSCGVGFITRKDSVQSHDVLQKGHEALCSVPHRGGMSSQGVGDGAGICVDLSVNFFRKITGIETLDTGKFGVGNFFMPDDHSSDEQAETVIEEVLGSLGLKTVFKRDVPVDNSAIRPAAAKDQFPIRQWVFLAPDIMPEGTTFDQLIHNALLEIEKQAYTLPALAGLYPVSLSAHTQVYKGRLSSHEVMPYFCDLVNPDHEIHTMFFHTRFSTNTDPHPTMAQPFRLMAHNGELNTDKKNRLSEAAIARTKDRKIIAPKGQSDSSRLDQTLERRLIEDDLDIVTAVVAMMPPAWENDTTISPEVQDMLEYFSLYEEKNDGPAALIFGNGDVVGARLDRLGLRPLRSVETDEYLCVMSEAGQIDFPPETIKSRGRIESGGMLFYDHNEKRSYTTEDALEMLAARYDYKTLLEQARININNLEETISEKEFQLAHKKEDLNSSQRYVAYSHNQESFKFLMDPMLSTGAEKISAMGYGTAINTLSDQEGGISKYFSQRFAQVTNPPLDSLREADGMTLRVALGAKPKFDEGKTQQIVINSPVLHWHELRKIEGQNRVPCKRFEMLFVPVPDDVDANAKALEQAIDALCDQIEIFARHIGGVAIISDRHINNKFAAIPHILAISAVNQRLIEEGLRFRISLIVESGQIASAHHIATTLGFGASAVYPFAVQLRAEEKYPTETIKAFARFVKASEKSLMKTMGKVGLCTAESYISGEFFEPNFLNTNDPVLKRYFPNVPTPVGGVGFNMIAKAARDWHFSARQISEEKDIPILGLFKERSEGAGHSFGTTAVRGFVDMTEEGITYAQKDEVKGDEDALRLMPLSSLEDAFGLNDTAYRFSGFQKRTTEEIDNFKVTNGYRDFSKMMAEERAKRPSALRDVLDLPVNISFARTTEEFTRAMARHALQGNNEFLVRGLTNEEIEKGKFRLTLTGSVGSSTERLIALGNSLAERFGTDILDRQVNNDELIVVVTGRTLEYMSALKAAPDSIPLEEVQPASEIAKTMASGAMSHGALNAPAHEAVAHGTNIAGGLSNSGEGGEHISRYGTIRSSKIKQFASGRFGVWAGYLADPMLEELEIKIAQGAKPGEGGQLPAPKVTVEIAAARGGTPGVELISPPPHHDTYSIEDLAQLIHDCKAARVKVIVKLVSSEGIGTIAVGVAKAGADVINVAGNTGGTGAAAVTSLKNTGRATEIGLAEVHQALCANGIRQKVILRTSGAHQTASDVIKSALLGADSFEFGTTALMMLKCVMAKNCNIKCPAGLTTNPEVFEGDPRALAQYLLNLSHETREILAEIGMKSLREARGRSDLLHLFDHPRNIGQLDLRKMLTVVPEKIVETPVYLEANYDIDDGFLVEFKKAIISHGQEAIEIGNNVKLNNRNKSVGGQLAIDVERLLNHELNESQIKSSAAISTDIRGRSFLKPDSVKISTSGSAGQSYGAFSNDGMHMTHTGTCNDGVGKGACGGAIAVRSPGGGSDEAGGNVLIGNFALFGASGGRLFVEGQAGDRFAVRNSGATAVVEGVGDFACEYMTNGAVVNLGSFGKGFGNGMSGGFAYQYDPYRLLEKKYSADSVRLANLGGDDEHAVFHQVAVQTMLKWHVEATGSKKAQWILDHWENECANFTYAMPTALLQYQDSDAILAVKSRKELIDELSTAISGHQLRKFKLAYRDKTVLMGGAVPGQGETDSEKMYSLLNNYTVLHMAQQIALSRLPKDTDIADPQVHGAVRKLILTEDFGLMSKLLGYAREALQGYDEQELAVLVGDKRLRDYKTALSRRNVLSMDSPGTYGWILHQDRKNVAKLGELPSFEELFAQSAVKDMSMMAVQG